MWACFSRDDTALAGFAKVFEHQSEGEREHAEESMQCQVKRGRRVQLEPIAAPQTEFNHEEKGEALFAMESALTMEKMVNEKLMAPSQGRRRG
jgi:ferritin heavy chain